MAIRTVYAFTFPDGARETFEISVDEKTLEVAPPEGDLPAWTELEFHKCSHCPLTPDRHPHCPLAAAISRAITVFESTLSYEKVDVEIRAGGRRILATASAQQALGSLLGLIMATSGCPHTAYFKPMARFHLPLADGDETVYRAMSMYLLAQYFMTKEGVAFDADLKGLRQIYENVQTLNRAMADRVRETIHHDAPVNAIVVLDFFAMTMPFAIEDQLESIAHLFTEYINRPPST